MDTYPGSEEIVRFKEVFQRVDSKTPTEEELERIREEKVLLTRIQSLNQQLQDAVLNEPLMTRAYKVQLLEKMIRESELSLSQLRAPRETVVEERDPPLDIPPPPPPPPMVETSKVPRPPPPPPPSKRRDEVEVLQLSEEERDDAPLDPFTTLEDHEQFGEGIWRVKAVSLYQPNGPIEVPGTGFKVIRPGQDHVNIRIVEAKLEAGLPATPVVPALLAEDGTVSLLDKHHTFVACMALGRPVKIALTRVPFGKPKSSWRECTWKGFEKPGAAGKGFGLSKTEAKKHEGEKQSSGDWRSIVPWRKNTPEDRAGKVKAVAGVVAGLDLGDALELASTAQDGLAERLYELLRVDRVLVKTRTRTDSSSGGDWDAEKQTIFLDDDLDPVAAVDMLVFESLNAAHEAEYSELRHEAHSKRMDPQSFGQKNAEIEARVTLEYVEFLLACQARGVKLAAQGERALASVERHVKGYSKMSPEERKLAAPSLIALICETPHGGEDKKLPDRLALTTRELYAYERIADVQNVKGVKAYFRDVIPKLHPKTVAFRKALMPLSDEAPTDPPWAALFYDITVTAANHIFKLSLPRLTDAQRAVAVAEYRAAGGDWDEALEQRLSELM